jgi:hypothetical protein
MNAERPFIMHVGIRLFCPFLMAVALLGCVHEPVPLELPRDHPANPQAAEMKFMPPPNPFLIHEETNSVALAGTPSVIHKHAEQAAEPLMEQPMGHHMGHGAPVEPAPDGLTHPHQMSLGHQHEDNP